MIIASAQINVKEEDIPGNLDIHYLYVKEASKQNANIIIFPEMSMTGYTREKALKLAFTERDQRLDGLKQMSIEKGIIIVAGAPVKIESKLYIGQYIIQPNGTTSIYTKQYLHEGEEKYFKNSSHFNPLIKIKDENIGFAICADIDNPDHAENAAKSGCSIYLASVFVTPSGIDNTYKLLAGYATKHKMDVLMSNYYGHMWNLEAGGNSAFWDLNGKHIASLNNNKNGLLIIEKNRNLCVAKEIL